MSEKARGEQRSEHAGFVDHNKRFKGDWRGGHGQICLLKRPCSQSQFPFIEHTFLSTAREEDWLDQLWWTPSLWRVQMHEALWNRFTRCCQQGRRGKKSFSLARVLWGRLLHSASLAESHHSYLTVKNCSWDWEEEVVVAVCRVLWVIGGKKGNVVHLIAF